MLDNCAPTARGDLQHDLSAVAKAVAMGICASRSDAVSNTFKVWETFCREMGLDPSLAAYSDPIPVLQIFAHRYRMGTVAPSQTQVRGRTVGDAVRAVGQTLAGLGHSDPRLQVNGKLDFRLSRQLSSYSKQDNPPTRVKPLPVAILQQALATARLTTSAHHQAIADMITLGFYFLLRPGEYALSSNPDATPFRLQDTHLMLQNRRLNPWRATQPELDQITFVGLEFTNQKNGVRGEIVGLGRSGDPTFCPVATILRRVHHLISHGAPPTQPLYSFWDRGQWYGVTSTSITLTLRATVAAFGQHFGLLQQYISARSLRSSGAMALLCANVDSDKIRLLGRWKSDEMLRYLHVQAFPVVAPLAAAMLRHGHYTIIPNIQLGANAPQP
jgi:hypothetical protein